MSRRLTRSPSAPPTDGATALGGDLIHPPAGLIAIGLVGLSVIIGSYLVALDDAVARSPLIGAAYVIIVLGSFASMNLIIRRTRVGWRLALAISSASIAGYLVKRRDVSPGLADNATMFIAGRLAETSLTAEGVVVAVSVLVLFLLRRSRSNTDR